MSNALDDLIAKVEAGSEDLNRSLPWSRALDPSIGLDARSAFNGSLDAALALHNAVLPGWVVNGLDQAANLAGDPWGCEVAYFNGSNPNNNRKAYSGHDYSSAARAWLLAILRAMKELNQ
tara:strand:- start:85 stop:444 length:360 start_codon:yes stop_codon:yes gene_type:complete